MEVAKNGELEQIILEATHQVGDRRFQEF